ncbi:NfeD family protein [Mariniplasma anaerobium]|uniref:Protease n=1 Tax=Mariniplasma anaerobium TaxID=2735436 RepID=A0A7U9TLS1_9MOLU|nr:NfeD family protein [Mariniplasma anaerobium]BCR35956.1 protease [Mariniplasma anaerobium]
MEWFIWLWLGVFVVALAFEFATADLVSIWFSLGAIPSFVLSLFEVNPAIQVVSFILVTAVLLLFTRPVVIKYFKVNEIKTNVDSVIGQEGIVTSSIMSNGIGRIKLRSQEWSAIADENIEVGQKIRVLDVEGNKLIVKKI